MVLMIMRARVDARKLEELSKQDPNPFQQIRDRAVESGGIQRHRVFATDDELIVVDEWDRPEDFQKFSETPELQQIFARLGVDQPDFTFARQLDLGDDIG